MEGKKMNNQTRNIILNINNLEKKLQDYEIYNQDIKITIDMIKENIKYMIEDKIQDYNYLLQQEKDNQELIKFLKENK